MKNKKFMKTKKPTFYPKIHKYPGFKTFLAQPKKTNGSQPQQLFFSFVRESTSRPYYELRLNQTTRNILC